MNIKDIPNGPELLGCGVVAVILVVLRDSWEGTNVSEHTMEYLGVLIITALAFWVLFTFVMRRGKR